MMRFLGSLIFALWANVSVAQNLIAPGTGVIPAGNCLQLGTDRFHIADGGGPCGAASSVPYTGISSVPTMKVLGRTTAGTGAAEALTLSANGASLFGAVSYAAMRALLDLEAGTDFYSITAADAAFYHAGGTDVAVADGGTGASTAGAAATNFGLGTADTVAFAALSLTSTDAGASSGPNIILDRNSASPAASDILTQIVHRGRNSAAAAKDYGTFQVIIDDPVSTSEDSHYELYPYVAGSQVNGLSLGAGIAVGSPTGGREGTGTVNATGYYLNGTLQPSYLTGTATYDPPSLLTLAGSTTTVTVTGAALGDPAVGSFSLDLQGVQVTYYVSATNTCSARFFDATAGTLDLASGTLKCLVLH